VSSNPRRAPVYFRFHYRTRRVGSEGAMCSLCLTRFAFMFIKLCFNFMFVLRIYPSCGQLPFSCLAFSSSSAILSHAGLVEVPASYQGSLGYFLAQSLLLLNGCSSERLMLMGGPECAACLAWFHTLSVCTLPP
jgi:hypothetical protein